MTTAIETPGAWPDDAKVIPDDLQARARALGCVITNDADREPDVDYGPFMLRCEDGYHVVWGTGLPSEGIADALDCLEREDQLPYELIGEGGVTLAPP